MIQKITVLLVEDHKIVRKGLKTLLELEPDIIVLAESDNGNDALLKAKELKPNVILIDIALPKLNGLDTCHQLYKNKCKSKILILSAHADDTYI